MNIAQPKQSAKSDLIQYANYHYQMQIELSIDFQKAIELIENGNNVFITGKAGTGKSTLLNYFRINTSKQMAVLAPTGVAAVNVNGETIHSFFGFHPGITPDEAAKQGKRVKEQANKLFQKLDIIIIDEVSMVRADLMDAIDLYLQNALKSKQPFGGKQVIFFGDLYQLPPVTRRDELAALQTVYATPYFFSAHVIQRLIQDGNFNCLELTRIYRQSEKEFIEALNAFRMGNSADKYLDLINQQHTFNSSQIDPNYIYLTARNDQADRVNQEMLNQLNGDARTFSATITGDFNDSHAPAPLDLRLRVGSRVMTLNNDPAGRYINGSLGHIDALGFDAVKVKLDNGKIVEIPSHSWQVSRTKYDEETKKLTREEVGSFTQIPLRLAWAITIHKSQGKTFDKVLIDLGSGAFAEGQTYVALSRCRTIGGIKLSRKIRATDIRTNISINQFMQSMLPQYNADGAKAKDAPPAQQTEPAMSMQQKQALLLQAIVLHSPLKIRYLKAGNQISSRIIWPKKVDRMEHNNRYFLGVQAYCEDVETDKIFSVESILQIDKVEIAN